MIHEPWIGKLDAYLDGELESQETQKLDHHLRECPECAAETLRRLQWKRAVRSAGQRYHPDSALREQMQRKISRGEVRRIWWLRWPALAASLLCVVVLVGVIMFRQNAGRIRENQIVGELVDLHVSALASSSPVDVVSSDRHTVKPWFEGKIPFTFNLPELQGTGFELAGGRVSYLQQSPGAELIFRVRKHQISAFIFQERAVPQSFAGSGEMGARSFHLQIFERDGLRYFVIGDASPEDLKALASLLKGA